MGTPREHSTLIVTRSIYPPSTVSYPPVNHFLPPSIIFYPPATCMCYLNGGTATDVPREYSVPG